MKINVHTLEAYFAEMHDCSARAYNESRISRTILYVNTKWVTKITSRSLYYFWIRVFSFVLL